MATDGGLTPRALVTTKSFERDLKRLVRGTPYLVRRERKVLIFSGCNSHPATGSLQPVAIEATRGGNETVGAFETDGSL